MSLSCRELYKKFYQESGTLSFSLIELRKCLSRQDNSCEICSSRFNNFNGFPVIVGNAEFALCRNCYEGLSFFNFNKKSLLKSIILVDKIEGSH